MKNQFESDDNREQVEKSKKNLIYVGMLSVVMLFAGLTSAYIVSMGDTFWLKVGLPTPFWISTGIIIATSIVFQLAVYLAKKGNLAGLKSAISLVLILGVGFIYFQFKGYGELTEHSVHFVSKIIVTEGKYGDYFEVKYKGDFIEINGNDFLLKGKVMNEKELSEYQKFMSQFLKLSPTKSFTVNQYGKDFTLYFQNTPLSVKGNTLYTVDDEELNYLDNARLRDLAINVQDLRGDFYAKGKLGKDFHIYYKGKELGYKDRQLILDGKKLDGYLQVKSMESADTASSYLFIITFVHLLHIFITLFYVAKLVIRSFTGKINSENTISLKVGAIFWHFLGVLWIYLLLFLLFIH
jgi:cytochrome c oxidase subunit 3